MKLTLKEVIEILADYDIVHCRFPGNYSEMPAKQLTSLTLDADKRILINSEEDTPTRRAAVLSELYQTLHCLKGDLYNLPKKKAKKIISKEAIWHFGEMFHRAMKKTEKKLTLRVAIEILAEYQLIHCLFPENYLKSPKDHTAGLAIDKEKLLLIDSEQCTQIRRKAVEHELIHVVHFQSGDLDHVPYVTLERLVAKQGKYQHQQLFCSSRKKKRRPRQNGGDQI